MPKLTVYKPLLSGVFAKLRKATSSFVMSVCPSVCPQWTVRFTMGEYIYIYIFFFFWARQPPCGPGPPHSQGFYITHKRRTTVGRSPLDEWSARRRDLYLTTRNTQNRQTSMPPSVIRTHDISRRAAADLRLRPRGHWDRWANLYNILYFGISRKPVGKIPVSLESDKNYVYFTWRSLHVYNNI